MKKLHTFHLWESPHASLLKNLLALEGVDCLLKNNWLSSAIGEIPFTDCYPELWVIDDEIYPRARLLLDAWLARDVDPEAEPWVCPACAEKSAQHFAVCWNCSRPRD